jgi:Tol biopolymer transport system component
MHRWLTYRRLGGLILGLGLLLAPGVAHAVYPGKNGRLVFTSPSDFNLYSIDATGRHRRQLTHDRRGGNIFPTLAADGQTLAFERYRDVSVGVGFFIGPLDGTSFRHVRHTGAGCCPALSPSGQKLAFSGDRCCGAAQIWTIRSDGSHARQLTHGNRWSVGPTFAPDGRSIAYVKYGQINVMDTSGRHHRRLTSGTSDAEPNFSPDGRSIAFSRAGHIFTMSSSGHKLRRRTDDERVSDVSPVFSPNGRRIAFVRFLRLYPFSSMGIWIMDADGKRLHQITASATDGIDWQAKAP